MAKKEFGKGIDALFEHSSNRHSNDRKKSQGKKKEPISRTTIILDDKLHQSIKALARWERKTLTAFIIDALITKISSIDASELDKALESYQLHINEL